MDFIDNEIIPSEEANCVKEGLTEGARCDLCGTITKAQETIPVNSDHNWSEDFRPGADTHWHYCLNEGCTAKKDEAAHNYAEQQSMAHVIDGSPCAMLFIKTCTECWMGLETETFWVMKENPVHDYDEGVITTPATCTKTGVKTYTCKNAGCGHTKTEEVPMIPHTEVDIPAKDATCTEEGASAGKMCSVCGAITAAPGISAPLNHTEVEIPAKAPTCTETGLTAGKKCSVCGTITKAQETVPMIAHTEVEIPAKEATCTETGLTAGAKCSVCGTITKAQETVAKKAHTEVEIPAKEATCTETGLTAGAKCSVCGTITKAQETVAAAGHKLSPVDAVAATYFAAGNIAHYACDNCDALFADEKGEKALTAADIVVAQLVKIEESKAEVSQEVVDTVVKEAVAAGTTNVVITVVEDKLAQEPEDTTPDSGTDSETPDSGTPKPPVAPPVVTKATLPVAAVQQVADLHKDATLTVTMTNATVTMDKTTLDVVTEKAQTSETDVIALEIEHIETEELAPEQQKAVEDKKVAAVISASILVNEEEVHDFEGGKVTVAIPFTPEEGTDGSDYIVLYIADDGSVEEIPTNYADGTLTMTLSHFSEYVVVNTSTKESGTPPTGDSFQPIVLVVLLSAAAAMTVLVCGKKRWAN